MDFSIDFGEGGRRRIEHTTRTHLSKDAEKARFGRVWIVLPNLRFLISSFSWKGRYGFSSRPLLLRAPAPLALPSKLRKDDGYNDR